MKKKLFEIVFIFLIISEVILIVYNYINKNKIAKILEINDVNDIYIQEIKESVGIGSERPIYIKFKISIDKYEKYNLKYMDVNSNESIYEGEITNKKMKISDKYYICYYEKVVYNKEQKDEYRKIKNDIILFKTNTIMLSFLILIYIINKNDLLKKEIS